VVRPKPVESVVTRTSTKGRKQAFARYKGSPLERERRDDEVDDVGGGEERGKEGVVEATILANSACPELITLMTKALCTTRIVL